MGTALFAPAQVNSLTPSNRVAVAKLCFGDAHWATPALELCRGIVGSELEHTRDRASNEIV